MSAPTGWYYSERTCVESVWFGSQLLKMERKAIPGCWRRDIYHTDSTDDCDERTSNLDPDPGARFTHACSTAIVRAFEGLGVVIPRIRLRIMLPWTSPLMRKSGAHSIEPLCEAELDFIDQRQSMHRIRACALSADEIAELLAYQANFELIMYGSPHESAEYDEVVLLPTSLPSYFEICRARARLGIDQKLDESLGEAALHRRKSLIVRDWERLDDAALDSFFACIPHTMFQQDGLGVHKIVFGPAFLTFDLDRDTRHQFANGIWRISR